MKFGGFSLHTESTNVALNFQERQTEPTTSGLVNVHVTMCRCLLGRHTASVAPMHGLQLILLRPQRTTNKVLGSIAVHYESRM